jgi:hypothetical protein
VKASRSTEASRKAVKAEHKGKTSVEASMEKASIKVGRNSTKCKQKSKHKRE